MTAAQWWIIGLSSLGSVLELAGIIVVAGRVGDLRKAARLAGHGFAAWARSARDLLERSLRWFRRRVLGRGSVVRVRAGVRATATVSVRARRIMGGSVDERIQRLDDEMREGFARIEAQLFELRMREPKDSARGVALLVVGLGCLLAASIIGALSVG